MQSPGQTVEGASDCTLVIMAKAPRPGNVKTRLNSILPVSAVTDFYRCLLNDTLQLAQSLANVEIAIMCPGSDVDEMSAFAGSGVRVVAQSGAGLAAALASAFGEFTPGGRRVVAFNSDSPHLSGPVLQSAFEALLASDIVVGPTNDGGYYLIGARDTHPALFEGDGMGTGAALDNLLARVRTMNLSVGFTDPFYDIDVGEDLVRLAEELRAAPDRAPRTAAWLKLWAPALAQLRTGTAPR